MVVLWSFDEHGNKGKMIKKALTQALSIVILFFSIWFVFMQIDWKELLNIDKVTTSTEQKLGELYWELFQHSEIENMDSIIINSIDSVVNKICERNSINRNKIKVHILNNSQINAFALPDGHLIIYDGLLSSVSDQEELYGVICHELAHIELDHIMQKLIKEVGISVLISTTSNNHSAEVIQETAQILSSTAFDRKLEKEADLKAIDYLIAAEINPEPFANFLYLLSTKDPDFIKNMEWLSTHPSGEDRAAYLVEHMKGKSFKHKSLLSPATWNRIKSLSQNN